MYTKHKQIIYLRLVHFVITFNIYIYRQFFEQFSQLFGNLTNLKNAASIKRQSSNDRSQSLTPPIQNVLSPSVSPNAQNHNKSRTPVSSIPNIVNINNVNKPLFKKQNSYSARSDGSNASSQGSAGIILTNGSITPNGNIIILNDPTNTNTANTTTTANINKTTLNVNKTIPVNTLNLTPLQNMVNINSTSNPFSPQPNAVCHYSLHIYLLAMYIMYISYNASMCHHNIFNLNMCLFAHLTYIKTLK